MNNAAKSGVSSPASAATKRRKIRLWAVLFWLLVWQAASMAIGSQILLVSPVQVLLRLGQLLPTANFWSAVLFSFCRIAGGFLLAAVTGVLLAALSARFRRLEELLAPAILTIKSIPVASFIILALIWFSSRNLAILISFLMVLPVVYTNVLGGIRAADPQLLEMARLFRLSAARRVRYIYVPQVLPFFRSACAVSLGLCWKSGIAAEVIGMPQGSIGERLQQAKVYLDTPDLFAWTLVIVLLSLAFERLFLALLVRGAAALNAAPGQAKIKRAGRKNDVRGGNDGRGTAKCPTQNGGSKNSSTGHGAAEYLTQNGGSQGSGTGHGAAEYLTRNGSSQGGGTGCGTTEHLWQNRGAKHDSAGQNTASSPTPPLNSFPPAITLSHIDKSYDGKAVLRDLTLVFPAGCVSAVMAPSGRGKTTLLRLLMGFERPDGGQIEGLRDARLSAVFQEDRLCDGLTAAGNLRLVSPALSGAALRQAMTAVGLPESCFAQPVALFSGGMRRRVAILRALLADGDVLLLDEPFKGLDEETKARVIDYTKSKITGKTVLLVTHEEEEAEMLGAKVLTLPEIPQ